MPGDRDFIGFTLSLKPYYFQSKCVMSFQIYKKRRRERIQSQKSDLSRRKELDER